MITTSGGLTAPLAHRGSRLLAAGGLERSRSLRRVASEADLSESASATDDFRTSTQDLSTVPLTAENARITRGSRDFTFARGISPPPLSPAMAGFGTPIGLGISGSSYRSPASQVTTADPLSSDRTMHTAPSSTHMSTAQAPSSQLMYTPQNLPPAGIARPWSSTVSPQTAMQSTPATTAPTYTTFDAHTAVPSLAITEPPSSTSGATAHPTATGMMTAPSGMTYGTIGETFLSSSPFETPATRNSQLSTGRETSSSYDTAPPPVPSHDSVYGSASGGPSTRANTPVRYQLHDEPVQSMYGTGTSATDVKTQWDTARATAAEGEKSSYLTAQAAARSSMAESGTSSIYRSAKSTAHATSEYSNAAPPPVSRSTTPGEYLSWRSEIRDNSETATHVSEPDTDVGLIADLERQSSAGSISSRALMRRRAVQGRSKYDTATEFSSMSYASRTPFGTIPENTMYDTARGTVYTMAPSWQNQSTFAATAQSQEYVGQ